MAFRCNMRAQRDIYIFVSFATSLVWMIFGTAALGQEKDFNAYPEPVAKHLKRLYSQSEQCLVFREDYPGGFEKWQHDARATLRVKLGMDKIAASVGHHQPSVELGQLEDLGRYTRQGGIIETEPDVRIPFWLLKPKGERKWPLGTFLTGTTGVATTPRQASTPMRPTKRSPSPRIVTWLCKP